MRLKRKNEIGYKRGLPSCSDFTALQPSSYHSLYNLAFHHTYLPKVKITSLLCLALTATASLIPRTDPSAPDRYTICGADRGSVISRRRSLSGVSSLLTNWFSSQLYRGRLPCRQLPPGQDYPLGPAPSPDERMRLCSCQHHHRQPLQWSCPQPYRQPGWSGARC